MASPQIQKWFERERSRRVKAVIGANPETEHEAVLDLRALDRMYRDLKQLAAEKTINE